MSQGFDLERFADEQALLDELPVINVDVIPRDDIENIVDRQWFEAAGELIRKSHETGVDISAPIRAGAQSVRTRIDELVKLLDPDYSKPHRMNPAFQWTQNDTSIFIQLKYSRRFNAPGSVDVTDFNCTFTSTSMIFSAIGGHSGKMFEYVLDLDFFDSIDPTFSKWMEGSVGKVSLTIQKLHPSKWPRLLLDKALKIDNMHYWFDFGEKQESILNTMSTISESGLTCSRIGQLYCSVTDQCISGCSSSCSGKPIQNAFRCEGPPLTGPKEVKFADTNLARTVASGVADISFVSSCYHNEFVNLYLVPVGGDLANAEFLRASPVIIGNQTSVTIDAFDMIDSTAELLALVANEYGENRDNVFRLKFSDAFTPSHCDSIDHIVFADTDPLRNSIKGVFTFSVPSQADGAVALFLYWGKSSSERHKKDKAINGDLVPIDSGVFDLTVSTAIPPGATHVLLFAKGPAQGGEVLVGALTLEDKYRPSSASKPTDVQLVNEQISFSVANNSENVSFYSLRVVNTKNQTKEIDNIPVHAGSDYYVSSAPFVMKKSYVQLCVYAGNDMGRSTDPACIDLDQPLQATDEL